MTTEDEIAGALLVARGKTRALLDLVHRTLFPKAVPTELQHDEWQVQGPALIARATTALEAIDALQDGCFEKEAAALVRVMYEHLVMFAWIAVDPETGAKHFKAYDRERKLKAAREVEALGPEYLKEGLVDRLKGELGDKLPPLQQRAKAADEYWSTREECGPLFQLQSTSLLGQYTSVYRNTSSAAHPTIGGLQQVVEVPTSGVALIDGKPKIVEKVNAFTMAPTVYSIGLIPAAVALGAPTLEEIQICMP